MAELVNINLEEILQSGAIAAIYLKGTDQGNLVLNKEEIEALLPASGASGSFTSQDGKTITVTNGIITDIT